MLINYRPVQCFYLQTCCSRGTYFKYNSSVLNEEHWVALINNMPLHFVVLHHDVKYLFSLTISYIHESIAGAHKTGLCLFAIFLWSLHI